MHSNKSATSSSWNSPPKLPHTKITQIHSRISKESKPSSHATNSKLVNATSKDSNELVCYLNSREKNFTTVNFNSLSYRVRLGRHPILHLLLVYSAPGLMDESRSVGNTKSEGSRRSSGPHSGNCPRIGLGVHSD